MKVEAFVVELLRSHEGHSRQRHASFCRYADPFFIWERCPHIRRLREEGKSITLRHARIQRQRLKKHVLKDPFARKWLSEITRAGVLDLCSRMLSKNAPATVNKALGIVKVIFREALYREEINRDPTAGVGRMKYHRVERGSRFLRNIAFSLRSLVSSSSLGFPFPGNALSPSEASASSCRRHL